MVVRRERPIVQLRSEIAGVDVGDDLAPVLLRDQIFPAEFVETVLQGPATTLSAAWTIYWVPGVPRKRAVTVPPELLVRESVMGRMGAID